MHTMKTTELVFFPCPGMGHVIPMLEMANRLAGLDPHVSITFLVMNLPSDSKHDLHAQSMTSSFDPRVKLSYLPQRDNIVAANPSDFLIKLIESHKPDVTDALAGWQHVSAFVVDMVCVDMMEVASAIGVPSYVFFPSSAACLGLMCYLQELRDRHSKDLTEYIDSDTVVDFPGFVNPLPVKLLPPMMITKETSETYLDWPRKFREAKGILVNTFSDLEPVPMKYLADLELPPVYPIGPIVRLNKVEANSTRSTTKILDWLDNQPELSVVFLCFGSLGSFGKDQVKEIAVALENAGHRFLWSLKLPLPKDNMKIPDDYTSFHGILPEGFLERTAGVGMVIGWASQVEILLHPSVGGFVSHCGWNSILESVWFSVPIGTWPQYSEQQLNAFLMVVELGLSVEVKMDYKIDFDIGVGLTVVGAEEIEKAIRELMKKDSEQRKKVKDMSEIGKKAMKEGGGGSSYLSLVRFIHDILG